ncbi:DUF6538 domain-containing protein [Thalassovita sp.]|uniref:DUF6538 domain-containing protein n=1 Tax=Thalassovita sp. TaxID=1979401 RepID=UPI002AB1ED67|nr:DUF6538 domain-containing protein [Thalassovita sp.]
MAYDISVPFSFKKSGIYYFERRVPRDLRRHYSSGKIAYSLRTRSAGVASSRAIKAAQQLDEYWYHLRLQRRDLPGKHLLRFAPSPSETVAPAPDVPKQSSVSLSEAVSIYLRLKGQGKTITFVRAAERACGYVIDACGDRDLLDYTKKDAKIMVSPKLVPGIFPHLAARFVIWRMTGSCISGKPMPGASNP